MMASLSVILKKLINEANRERLIKYRTLPRGLNLIYTPPMDETGPATLRLSRKSELVSQLHINPPRYKVVYPSDKEVEIVKRALKPLISPASFKGLRVNKPFVATKNGREFGSVSMSWYMVNQKGLL